MELDTIIVCSGKNGNPIDDTLRILRNEDNYGTFGEKEATAQLMALFKNII